MSDTASDAPKGPSVDTSGLPEVHIQRPSYKIDLATILGLLLAIALIIGAIALGQSNANFFNVPSLMIVVFGTMAATAVSFTGEELKNAGTTLRQSWKRRVQNPSKLASSLIDLSVSAKKKGVLVLSSYESELSKDPFVARAVQMVIDGYQAKDIDFLLSQEIDAQAERHKRATNITRRASEVAPAMGLIGTLVGLVQMLADLENPETIGPAMAVALLTTFYGAILGTVVMAPLSVKLEKRSKDEAMLKNLTRIACISMASQDNPRKLEMLLNSELPPSKRIRYFD